MIDAPALANELFAAAERAQPVAVPPSARDAGFGLDDAYAVANELTRLRRAAGRSTIGVKVGYANKAVWRALKLDTLVWGPMYDNTVRFASAGQPLDLSRMVSPKIEPELVVKLRSPIEAAADDAAGVLRDVEWLALGFEVIDCPFPDWKFQPVDFVAAFGLHAALVVGPPRVVDAGRIPGLVDALARFKVRLLKDDQVAAEGSGRNSLRNPALCVGELSAAVSRRKDAEPLRAGDLVSTGTLTESQAIAPGQTWRAEVDGIDLDPVSVRTA